MLALSNSCTITRSRLSGFAALGCAVFIAVALILFASVQTTCAAQITLSWDANSEPDLAGYRLHYGTTSRTYENTVDVGMQTNYAFTGLQEGVTYYFAATAYDIYGNESDYSQEVFYYVAFSNTDSDGDGLTDYEETTRYGTDSNNADTDGDGIHDSEELAYWGQYWNADFDGDGLINILDADADGDGFSDGVELDRGSNAGSANTVIFALNAGGPQYVDAKGIVYNADTLYSGGRTSKSSAAISGTADDTLYQTERYGNFSYAIPLPNGEYLVTLKFSETYFSAAGKRSFDVVVEGDEVVSNLDLFVEAGRYAAYDLLVPTTVHDGILNIVFRSDVNNAKINAIVVETDGEIFPDDTGAVFAINVGGPRYVDTTGTVYNADTLFAGGRTYKTGSSISSTVDDALYQTERYGNFSYAIPLPNGDYLVTLKFAEILYSAVGKRIFDVLVEDNEEISNLDLFARAGKYQAYDLIVPANVTDGVLNINFRTDVYNAKVGAILIQR